MAEEEGAKRKPNMSKKLKTAIIIWIIASSFIGGWGIRTNREANNSNRQLIVKVAANTNAIQEERKDSIRRSCRDSNKRHDDTLKVLKKLLNKNPTTPAQKAATYKSTKFLINALVPKQNCEKLVARAVSPT